MSSAELNDRDVLIRQLSEAAESIDKNDLVVLADIHGWCESLVASDGEGGTPGTQCAEQIAAIRDAAEQLIMCVADNPEAEVETIRKNAAAIASAGQTPSETAPSSSASPETADASTSPASDNPLVSVIQELSQAVANIETDNLTLLAKMHGWCGELAAAAQPGSTSPNPEIAEEATVVGQTLETLILGACGDTDVQLKLLREQVNALNNAVMTAAAASDPSSDASTANTSDPTPASSVATPEPVAETPAPQEPATATPEPAAPTPTPTPTPPASDNIQPSFVSEPLLIDPKELEFVGAFAEEAAEHLEAIEGALLEVEQSPHDTDKINELFRPFHTIKGMAGFLNLRDVNSLTHEVETVLDQGRRGEREVTSGTTDLVFEVVDILKEQLAAIGAFVQNPTDGPVSQPPVSEMIDRLRGVIAGRIDPDADGKAKRDNASEAPAQPTSESNTKNQAEGTPAASASQTTGAEPKATAPSTPSATPATPAPAHAATDQSVRIDTRKLDALVDMVGELVIAQTLVAASDRISTDQKLAKDASQVSKIVRDVQEVAMAMRMIPIKSTFQKMARLVRDLSRKADKKVELTISGEETELDKNVIQQIGDPLVHMVRNAVDHGIETTEDRRNTGKPPCGRVHLNAFHQGGNIVIEITDDGKGLDRDTLIAKAIEKGIIGPDDELTDEQAYQLVFAAGFSTAKVITDISGRGVGMDVVKRNIEQLRGRVDITSEVGKGSTFSIRLPLTLAIIDGMLVRIGKERFIIATPTIEQALRPVPEQITTVQNRGEVMQIRGQLIPLIQLGQLFRLTERVEPCESMVVIAHTDRGLVGLVVEELIGQQQVVIKSLGERFRELRGVSGAAILGDGRVGLILDATGIRAIHDEWHTQATIRPEPSLACADSQNAHRDAEVENAPTETAIDEDSEQPVLA